MPPADNAVNVSLESDIVLPFSENVHAGGGNIVISYGTDIRTIAVTDSLQVSISGNTLIINPTADLHSGSHYHVEIDNGAIQDMAGNAFAGTTAFDFATAVANTPPQPLCLGMEK